MSIALTYFGAFNVASDDGVPFHIYRTCIHVLHAAQDARVEGVMQTAHMHLHAFADNINDPDLRQPYLAWLTQSSMFTSLSGTGALSM
jgi:hypothetical protein